MHNMYSNILFEIFLLITLPAFIITCVKGQDSSDDDANIRLFYYPNEANSSQRNELSLSDSSSFEHASLNKGRRAKILVHGAHASCLSMNFPFLPVEAYLRAKISRGEDYNVFCLDYGPIAKYAANPREPWPTLKSRYEYLVNVVGNKTAKFIEALETHGIVVDIDQIHLIGHSLGGHVVGVTGRRIRELEKYRRKIGRITGLDVMNIFLMYSNEINLWNQIDSSDASFVDIVHTSDGLIGLRGDYGQVDFYPDGGERQKSCLSQSDVISNITEIATGACSHTIVGKYWANSIDNPTLPACKANSYQDFKGKQDSDCLGENVAVFGEYVSQKRYGKFYLEHPFTEP